MSLITLFSTIYKSYGTIQILFSFIYNTFKKKFLILAK